MSRRLFPRLSARWISEFALLVLLVLIAHLRVASGASRAHTCREVKTAFQLRQIGPLKWVPETPATDVNLLVCKHVGPSCCTRKMEESYKLAATRDTLHNLRLYTTELRHLLLSHAAAFQDSYQSLLLFSQGQLTSLFELTYPSLSSPIASHVSSLFSQLSLFIQADSNVSVEATVHRFYNHLFPFVHSRIINPGIPEENDLSECLRATQQDVDPFGHRTQVMANELAQALKAARSLNRAFYVTKDLLNSTEAASLTNECVKALLKMHYCPHCQGLTLIRPCPEFCLNVLGGCLASLAELDMPWRHYVAILEDLTHAVAGEHSLELALLRVSGHVNETIQHAELHSARISATVDKVCGQSTTKSPSIQPTVTPKPSTNQSDPPDLTQLGRLSHLHSSLPLKPNRKHKDKTLKQIAREFVRTIGRYKAFFAALPRMLCEGEIERDELTCWSGDDVVESYKGRVVGNGVHAQRQNPEVKVRGPDPLLMEVKERFEQFNKEMQESMPGLGHRESWEDPGSGEDSSGECDDEDGCQGSGEVTVKSSNTDSRTDPEVAVKPPPHEAPVVRSKPGPGSSAPFTVPSFIILVSILALQCTLN
ncbi:glypican-5 [Trichomycterus rosablanca]|uniref:glypican-5 n=1 Tax=Trichomycterus rosablanca TaxID=2290929 RepID=UPI002F35F087